MKGSELKQAITRCGAKQAEVARRLGESQQNFSAALAVEDVRSSLIERVAVALEMPVSFFYGEGGGPSANAFNNSTAIAGNANLLNQQLDKCLDLLKEKDIQVSRFQSEIETLLDIIKSQSK